MMKPHRAGGRPFSLIERTFRPAREAPTMFNLKKHHKMSHPLIHMIRPTGT